MGRYAYKGPVYEFDRCIEQRWACSTYAVSEKKAKTNLTYQYKKSHNRLPNAKISLPGEIIKVEETKRYG